jgi:hypothetical protein
MFSLDHRAAQDLLEYQTKESGHAKVEGADISRRQRACVQNVTERR